MSDALVQQSIFSIDDGMDDARFRTRQLVTYLGNKRSIVPKIEAAVRQIRADLGGRRLTSVDAFSGSGAVARMLKAHSSCVIVNDLEDYAGVISRCFLSNRGEVDVDRLHRIVRNLNWLADEGKLQEGFISQLYAPADENDIKAGDRVFYTRDNARRLDTFRNELELLDHQTKTMLLGPLLAMASVHANTSGVFKGFYKDQNTGIGKYGGSGADALSRILAPIRMEIPVLSNHSSETIVLQEDANDLPDRLDLVDLVYLDPPYNQHPYGSNYFMLNLVANYLPPSDISKVSGIPVNWRRSGYNVRAKAPLLLRDLAQRLPARFLIVSFNDEGFVSPSQMLEILQHAGRVSELKMPYNTFRGSRNLRGRSAHVTEHLYVVDTGRH